MVFIGSSGVVQGSFGGRSGVVQDLFRGHFELVWRSFGVRRSFNFFSFFLFENLSVFSSKNEKRTQGENY